MAGSPVSQGMPKNGGRDNALGVRRHDAKPRDRSRSSEDVRLSKQMSKTLRHKPPSCMDSSGWVPLHELVTHIGTAKSAEHILRVVTSDVKGRFEIDMKHEPPRVRATQGHSITLEAPILQPVTDGAEVPVAVHLTRPATWQLIQQDGFLRRQKRTHIHFATKPALARTNKWASCYLQLDVKQALEDGVPLHLSSNGVLLTAGPLPVKYVTEVAEFPAVQPAAPATEPHATGGGDESS